MWIWLQSYKIFFKEVLIWQTLTRYSAHFPLKWIKMPCKTSAWIIFLHWTTASFCLQVPIAVRNDSLGIHFYLFWLARKNAPIAQWSWQMLKMGKFRLLNSLNEMLNLILSYNPSLAFQSCCTPSNCNYTFLYLSIMGTTCYMLNYNCLR